MNKKYISRNEAAEILGVSSQTISNYADKGIIHIIKRRGCVKVRLEDVEKLATEIEDIVGIETRIANYKAELQQLEKELQKEQILKHGFTALAARNLIELFEKYVPSENRKDLDVTAYMINYGYKNTEWHFKMTETEVLTCGRRILHEIRRHHSIFELEADNNALKEHINSLIIENEMLRTKINEMGSNADEILDVEREKNEILATPIIPIACDHNMTVRSLNCIKAAEIRTVGDLISYSKRDLLRLRNMGKKSLREIIEFVESLGLELAD